MLNRMLNMKFTRFLLLIEILMVLFILIVGFSANLALIHDELLLIIISIPLLGILVYFVPYSMARLYMKSFEKVRIDSNKEDYHLYLDKLEKIYISPALGFIGYILFVATMLQFFYNGFPVGMIPEKRILFPEIHIEKYLLILWAIWHALVGLRNYFYKRVLLSKD